MYLWVPLVDWTITFALTDHGAWLSLRFLLGRQPQEAGVKYHEDGSQDQGSWGQHDGGTEVVKCSLDSLDQSYRGPYGCRKKIWEVDLPWFTWAYYWVPYGEGWDTLTFCLDVFLVIHGGRKEEDEAGLWTTGQTSPTMGTQWGFWMKIGQGCNGTGSPKGDRRPWKVTNEWWIMHTTYDKINVVACYI